jgi:hypothetical protein
MQANPKITALLYAVYLNIFKRESRRADLMLSREGNRRELIPIYLHERVVSLPPDVIQVMLHIQVTYFGVLVLS